MTNIEKLKEVCAEEWRAFYLSEGRNFYEVESIQLSRACNYNNALDIVTGKSWYYNRLNKEMQISAFND